MPADQPSPSVSREGTRERILAAAESEFAGHGIAGARVDRIAKRAHTSKERVYAHFSSKEALYSVVARHQLSLAAEAAPLDPSDLPTYAGALFDYFLTYSDRHRFLSWGRLELRPDSSDSAATASDDRNETPASAPAEAAEPYGRSMIAKVEKIRQAQQAGLLDRSWDPVDILALVGQLAFTHVGQPELADLATQVAVDASIDARRAAVVRAVHTLFPPTTSSGG